MYKLEQKVYIKTVKRPGVIKDLTNDSFALVTYFINNARYTQLFKLDEIMPFRPNRKPLTVRIKYFDKEYPKLEKIAIGDLIDLRSRERIEYKVGDYFEIPLGVAMEIPKGWKADIVPRSSTFKKWFVIQTNSVGKVDNSYSGDEDEWRMGVYALGNGVIEKYDRVCQFELTRQMPKVIFDEVESLGNESRGGFGSTGTN